MSTFKRREKATTSGEVYTQDPSDKDWAEEPDNVNHPAHYALPGGIECFDVMLAVFGVAAMQLYCVINAFKYLFRFRRKNGTEDVKKARWYIDKYIELKEKEGAEE